MDRDTKLLRADATAALRAQGFPICSKTLALLACRGGGPAYSKFGKVSVYLWGDVIDWANGRMTAPRRKTERGTHLDAA